MSISLKAARVNAGLTQTEAAKSFGVSKATVINWELEKSYPDAKQIKLICDTYGMKYEDIIFCSHD